jgi:hypothetical protein
MTLLGCGQSGAQCTTVMTLPMAYSSETSCLADRDTMRQAVTGYATVIAQCSAKARTAANAQTRLDHGA